MGGSISFAVCWLAAGEGATMAPGYTFLPRPSTHGPPRPHTCRVKVIHELRELVEQKEQFIALMSHELRTPVSKLVPWVRSSRKSAEMGKLSHPRLPQLNGIIGLSSAMLMDTEGIRWEREGGQRWSDGAVTQGWGPIAPTVRLRVWPTCAVRKFARRSPPSPTRAGACSTS